MTAAISKTYPAYRYGVQPPPPGKEPGGPPPVRDLPRPPQTTHSPAGWYADPWGSSPWRWWDGWAWTGHVSANRANKPRLKGWLSWPVIVGAVVAVPLTALLAIDSPLSVVLAFIPVCIVAPVLWWLDRVEPEPLEARVHAFLWGATISGVVAGSINTVVFVVSSETWAAVVSAPITEEAMKTLGIIWALRRKEIDGVMDGVVYAGWVALGFAVVENLLFFSDASESEALLGTVVARGFLTPFAHPLFTAWSGLAIGWAVSRRIAVSLQLVWGLPLAVVTHAAWNGSLAIAEDNEVILLVAVPGFVLLFAAAGLTVTTIRRRERRHFIHIVPMLADRYGLTPSELAVFGNWRTMLRTRRRLSRRQRSTFDQVHGTLARLAALHHRPGELDVRAEAILVHRLHQARAGR